MSSSKRDFSAGVYLSEAPSPRCSFEGSESGQIQSVKLLQNMVSNRIPYPPPPYTLHTYIHYTFSHGEGGGGFEPEIRLEGQQFTKLGLKYPHD
jgi:hypothetical protein